MTRDNKFSGLIVSRRPTFRFRDSMTSGGAQGPALLLSGFVDYDDVVNFY